jgi:predicted transcriptional regulator of viral defense system
MNVMLLRPAAVSDWLIALGRHFVTNDELAELVGVPATEVRHSLRRQRDLNTLVPVTKGAWVPVPPQYRRYGAPPVDHFIDPLMNFFGHRYYVGFLTAAAIHGASHQAAMVFQVVTNAALRDRTIGAQRVSFIRRSDMERRATVRRVVPTGRINVSTPEVTVLDLVETPSFGAGLSNVATVIAELLDAGVLDPVALGEQANHYSTAVIQRVGHLVEQMGNETDKSIDLAALWELVDGAPLVDLYPRADRSGQRDDRWNVMANIDIEPDL